MFFMKTISFLLPGFQVTECFWRDGQLTVEARSLHSSAVCPRCSRASVRVHSWYQRRPQDLPVSGEMARLTLHVRRFRCLNAACHFPTHRQILRTALIPAMHTHGCPGTTR